MSVWASKGIGKTGLVLWRSPAVKSKSALDIKETILPVNGKDLTVSKSWLVSSVVFFYVSHHGN